MRKTLLLICIILILLIILVVLLGKGCDRDNKKFSFTISMPSPVTVSVDSVYVDTVLINNLNLERINLFHEDEKIKIWGVAYLHPTLCSLFYEIKPIYVSTSYAGDSLVTIINEGYQIDVSGIPPIIPSSRRHNIRVGMLRDFNSHEFDYYLGYGYNVFRTITLEAGVTKNGTIAAFLNINF